MAASSPADHASNGQNGKQTAMDCVGGHEIINIGIGQCGIFMLSEYYSLLLDEHKISRDGTFTGNWNDDNDKLLMLKHNTFFREDKLNRRYVPRAMFMDCDQSSIDNVQSSYFGKLLPEQHLVSASSVSESCIIWPKGHYTEGAEMIDVAVDTVRRDVERCDYIQGFCMYHSLGGGWGSGFGTLLLLKLRDNYPDRFTCTYSVYPSARSHTTHNYNFQTYNAILSLHQFLENSDICYTLDNAKLARFAKDECKLKHATYADLNWLLATMMSGTTSTFRFHCEPTVCPTFRSLATLFIPFPRLHFFALAHSPFVSKTNFEYNENVTRIIQNLFSFKNETSDIKLYDGKTLQMVFSYRSNDEDAMLKMETECDRYQQRNSDDFVMWIPDNVASTYVYDGDYFYYKQYAPIVSSATAQTTAIKSVFHRLSYEFGRIYRRRVWLHWYKGEGMDELEFQEADKNVRDLIQEYQDKQDAVVYENDEVDEDEDEEEEEEDMSD